MVQNESNPKGVPLSVFDEICQGTGFTRAQYFYDFPVAFYGWNRGGKKVQEGIKHNWWRQGMMIRSFHLTSAKSSKAIVQRKINFPPRFSSWHANTEAETINNDILSFIKS